MLANKQWNVCALGWDVLCSWAAYNLNTSWSPKIVDWDKFKKGSATKRSCGDEAMRSEIISLELSTFSMGLSNLDSYIILVGVHIYWQRRNQQIGSEEGAYMKKKVKLEDGSVAPFLRFSHAKIRTRVTQAWFIWSVARSRCGSYLAFESSCAGRNASESRAAPAKRDFQYAWLFSTSHKRNGRCIGLMQDAEFTT